ncbi:MAG: hemerythrin [Syntrophomonadaceae bacterium]|nr:hemerythrin [Syntrophomonadaceae bacterium]
MKATQQLIDEHRAVNLMLKVFDHALLRPRIDLEDVEQIIGFLKGFVDKCHHGKEEDLLFPELIRHGMPESGGPIGQMLYEHQTGRSFIADMEKAVRSLKNGQSDAARRLIDAGRKYRDLLVSHIEKEDQVLFKMADNLLDETVQNRLYEEFELLETERMGPGQHERYHELLNNLAAKYLGNHGGHHHLT